MSMHNPAHPGEILQELVIEPLKLTVTDIAEHLNVSRKTLSEILNGRGVMTPEVAARLELVFKKPSADHWLRLQHAHDLWRSRQNRSNLEVKPYQLNLHNDVCQDRWLGASQIQAQTCSDTGARDTV